MVLQRSRSNAISGGDGSIPEVPMRNEEVSLRLFVFHLRGSMARRAGEQNVLYCY